MCDDPGLFVCSSPEFQEKLTLIVASLRLCCCSPLHIDSLYLSLSHFIIMPRLILVSPLQQQRQSSPEAAAAGPPPVVTTLMTRASTETPQQQPETLDSSAPAKQVTPAEQEAAEKQVRFVNNNEKNHQEPNQAGARACVSKRGRYVSPGRRNGSTTITTANSTQSPSVEQSSSSNVVEYKTYRSPADTSTVPSLCSAPSQDGDSKVAAKEDKVRKRMNYW